jgi:hypothetical protein
MHFCIEFVTFLTLNLVATFVHSYQFENDNSNWILILINIAMSHLASNYAKIRNSKPFTTVKISVERYNFKDKKLA